MRHSATGGWLTNNADSEEWERGSQTRRELGGQNRATEKILRENRGDVRRVLHRRRRVVASVIISWVRIMPHAHSTWRNTCGICGINDVG